MRDTQGEYDDWLDLVGDLVRDHVDAFPRAVLADRLQETFGEAVAWCWADEDGSFGLELQQSAPGFPSAAEAEVWVTVGMAAHPLVCWYGRTGDLTPTTVGRVPRDLVPGAGFAVLRELFGPRGWEQQLALPYASATGRHRSFVLARGGDDFTDREVDLARRLHPLLALLERQARVLRVRSPDADTAGLTARELAVLVLLRDGLTAVAISHRLDVSPRTVHAHLRSIYRKLGVADRMRAVLIAQDRGVIPGAPAPRTDVDGVPLAQRWVGPRPARAADLDVLLLDGTTSPSVAVPVAERPAS
jgi:DNA-binding CsgD family transcriptional regulator